jgi:hypothetical protein
VKNNIEQLNHFDVQKEKETFKEERHEFLKKHFSSTSTVQKNHNSPMYKNPSSMDHTSKAQPLERVSNMKSNLQSCVNILNDPPSIKIFQNLLEICKTRAQGKLEKKIVIISIQEEGQAKNSY